MRQQTEKTQQLSSRVKKAHGRSYDVHFHTTTQRNLGVPVRKTTGQTQRDCLSIRILLRLLKSRRRRNDAFGFLRKNDFQVRILGLDELSIKSEGRIHFLRNCVSENIILQTTFLRSTYSRMYSFFQKNKGVGWGAQEKEKHKI